MSAPTGSGPGFRRPVFGNAVWRVAGQILLECVVKKATAFVCATSA